MLKPNSLPKELIIRRKAHVTQLFTAGKQLLAYPVKLTLVATAENTVGVIFLVPKRLHKRAVVRNLLRRRMREALRLNKALIPGHSHIALNYIAKEECDFSTIQNAVTQLLRSLSDASADRPR